MTLETITLPAFWACALINADFSGLDQGEIDGLNAYLSECGIFAASCLDCGPEYVGRFKGMLCEVSEFTFARG